MPTTTVNTGNIAKELDRVQEMPMDNSMGGWFSEMDQQVRNLLERFPSLAIAHAGFSRARMGIRLNVINKQSWEQMKRAADGLANELRKLGNTTVPLCEHRTSDGICRYALMPDGTCAVRGH